MPVINHTQKEIHAKIVYVGPPGAGKRTCVNLIHSRLKPDCRSELKLMGNAEGGVLYFSFLPHELGSVDGYRVRFHLYVLDGIEPREETLRMVLKGVDGLMFVADASPERLAENEASVSLLEKVLSLSGTSLRDLPVLAQINRKDLLPQGGGGELVEVLATHGLGAVFSDALLGEGVLQAVTRLVKGIMQKLRQGGAVLSEIQMPHGRDEAEVDLTQDDDTEHSPTLQEVSQPEETPEGSLTCDWSLEGGGAVRVTDGNRLTIPVVLAGPHGQRCSLTISLTLDRQEL